MNKSKANSKKSYLPILAGLIAIIPVHAEDAPEMWGPKAVSPASFHVPEPLTVLADESFKYVPLHPVPFNSGQITISREGQQALDAAADYLLKYDDIKRILIEGNADRTENNKKGGQLSDQRTEMVRSYLALKGVDPNLIVMSSKGVSAPIDQHWTREGRQRNRQVSIYAIHWQRLPPVPESE